MERVTPKFRAAMVATSGACRWSSYKALALGASDVLVTPHAVYRSLAHTNEERRARYQALVADVLDEAEVERIRACLQQQRALGPKVPARHRSAAGTMRHGSPCTPSKTEKALLPRSWCPISCMVCVLSRSEEMQKKGSGTFFLELGSQAWAS